MPKCVFTQEHFHWREDRPPRHSWSDTVIYETHVRGFTIHPSSGVEHPGTYRGLMEKIPYFKELGVTAVELMPVQEFNEHQVIGINPQTGHPLRNYWGYDPVVRDHIYTALRYWVVEMHIDGFRFDLAAVLGRGRSGNLLPNPPLLERIAEDPILRDVKIIAEAWDAAGAYEVGSFSERRWAEWNGQYRDDVRRFWRGDDGFLGVFAQRICGSADLYSQSGKGPESSINFVTCHDGFTLHDLVSYRQKHNEPNGQNNHDVMNENFSENYGAEGETADGQIESIRKRQIKNFLLTLFISRGVPMLLGGDEFRRTQGGNNNPYCQDNETSWHDWRCLEQHREIFRFTRGMIAFRRAHPVLSKEQFYTDAEIRWFGPQGGLPDWADPKEKQFSCLIHEDEQRALCLMFNAGADALEFGLPPVPPGARWHLAVDTSRQAPQDLFAAGEEPLWENSKTYRLSPRSGAVLLAR